MLLEIRISVLLLNLLIPPCLFQFHRKHKKNSILIQNTYIFCWKIPQGYWNIYTKLNTIFDITQTLKELKAQILLGQESRPSRPHPPSGYALSILLLIQKLLLKSSSFLGAASLSNYSFCIQSLHVLEA